MWQVITREESNYQTQVCSRQDQMWLHAREFGNYSSHCLRVREQHSTNSYTRDIQSYEFSPMQTIPPREINLQFIWPDECSNWGCQFAHFCKSCNGDYVAVKQLLVLSIRADLNLTHLLTIFTWSSPHAHYNVAPIHVATKQNNIAQPLLGQTGYRLHVILKRQ